jgi:hypothetical protein
MVHEFARAVRRHRSMGKMMKHPLVVLISAAFLSAGLITGCANSNEKSTSPAVAPGPAEYVGVRVCTGCHAQETADWMSSKHGNLNFPGDLYSAGVPTLGEISGCTANCHDPNGDSAHLTPGHTGNVPRPVIGCEACHGPGSLHVAAGGTGPIGVSSRLGGVIGTISTVQVSAQFATCTFCHELLSSMDPAGIVPATAVHDAGGSDPLVVSLGSASNANSITDTHFALPSSWRSLDGLNTHNTVTDYIAISGYAMDFADEKVCSNCHNPHSDATVNREWALSAHADLQGIRLEPKSGSLVGTGFFSGAWAHYNWTCDGTSNVSCGPAEGTPNDFRECQRCHTTTGFAAFVDALRAGNTGLANAIRTGASPQLSYTPYFKPEMLKCNGCHIDNRGILRNPGPITAIYDYSSGGTTYSRASHAFPDVAGSNVCMACHTGRESGETIKNLNQAGMPSVNFANQTFINSHYLTAGGTVFGSTGYTFGGRNYANVDFYKHDQIGTPAAPNTGTNGPCIGCHMSRPNKNGDHIFLPVSRVRSGETVTITGIASEVCYNCHGPNDVLMLDLVREQRELFSAGLAALRYQLEKQGFYFADAYPYFYRLRDRNGQISVTMGSAVVTGVGTDWLATSVTGTDVTGAIADRLRVNGDGAYYAIQSVNSATQLTLQAPYAGSANTGGAPYTIIESPITDWLTAPDSDTTGAVSGKNNMGSAFNFNLLEHDPGAYAHNRYYTKRLIYDSIDWLDDNQLNYSTGMTMNVICNGGSAPAWCAEAMTYLLPNGVIPGVAAERP